MARPGRQERNRTARSFRQLTRFHHGINSDEVFGTHKQARPAPKKMTASPSIRQVIEAGPKIPSTDPAARARTKSRAASRSLSETKCAPFETDGDRFIPPVCAVYRNSASQSPLNVIALRDLLPLGTQRLSVSPYHTRTRLRFAETLERLLYRSLKRQPT